MVKTQKPKSGAAINIFIKAGLIDAAGNGIVKDIQDLNISGVETARVIRVYTVEGKLTDARLQRIGGELLADPITQEFSVGNPPAALTKGAWVVHVRYNPGVTDTVGETALKGIADLGISAAAGVRTSTIFVLRGSVTKDSVNAICRRLLANGVIQSYTIQKK